MMSAHESKCGIPTCQQYLWLDVTAHQYAGGSCSWFGRHRLLSVHGWIRFDRSFCPRQ